MVDYFNSSLGGAKAFNSATIGSDQGRRKIGRIVTRGNGRKRIGRPQTDLAASVKKARLARIVIIDQA